MVERYKLDCIKYDILNEKVQYLIESDELLGRLINYIGTSELILERNGFTCIVKYIIGQQISDKTREKIWQRLCSVCGDINPAAIMKIGTSDLKKVGLPSHKIECMKRVAKAVMDKVVDFDELPKLSNEEVIARLTSIRGIGQWTAEMYLIFSLGRENVLSKGDGTIKRAVQWMYNLKELPSGRVLRERFIKWEQYATIVSLYLWKSIELGLPRRTFEDSLRK